MVLLPEPEVDWTATAAELVGAGVDVLLAPGDGADSADRGAPAPTHPTGPNADLRTVARLATWLRQQAPGPCLVVAAGGSARLLPALATALRAAHRLVTAYVLVDATIPAPASALGTAWPDAPVWWVRTDPAGGSSASASESGARADADERLARRAVAARLRGFEVVETSDVAGVVLAASR